MRTIVGSIFVLVFLCIGEGRVAETYIDVFHFIREVRNLQPLTIAKLEEIGFVVPTMEVLEGQQIVYTGTGPTLGDGTQFWHFEFRISPENPSYPFLFVRIANTCITYIDFAKVYATNFNRFAKVDTAPGFSIPPLARWAGVQEEGAGINFGFSEARPSCVERFNIWYFPGAAEYPHE